MTVGRREADGAGIAGTLESPDQRWMSEWKRRLTAGGVREKKTWPRGGAGGCRRGNQAPRPALMRERTLIVSCCACRGNVLLSCIMGVGMKKALPEGE